jgi:dienelactone hydrolase
MDPKGKELKRGTWFIPNFAVGLWRSLMACLVLTWIVAGGSPMRANTITPTDPALVGPCSVTSQDVRIARSLDVTLYYPSGSCATASAPPYPVVVFAHGFSMFGLSDGRRDNAGNGEHLASWGYVTALPKLPDDFAARRDALRDVVDYVVAQASAVDGPLVGIVDAQRIALVGHSLGGVSVLALAAQDARIAALVALDPVYHGGMPGSMSEVWDPRPDAPRITAPTGILGAPPSSCNAQADYTRLYPLVGARPKASFEIVGASHCAFNNPGSSFCGLICSGSSDAQHKALGKRYMTAWLNVYLAGLSAYDTYLYGAQADEDIHQGRIVRQVEQGTERKTYLPIVSR